MPHQPQVETRAEQTYLAIGTTASLADWGQVNALIPEVLAILASTHSAPAGPLLYRYREIGNLAAPLVVEVGFPTDRFIPCEGRAHPDTVPAGRYLTYRHVGRPDTMSESFALLERWLVEHGERADAETVGDRTRWAGRFEFYLTNPEEQPDPSTWEIDLAWRLRDRP